MPVIRIKPETYDRLKHWAIPLEDTPNDAIERVLDAAEEHRACRTGAAARDREIAEAQKQDNQEAPPSSRE